jgi:hypothetical protein
MAQSALTVTPPNPSPPTNLPSTGSSMPNPPNFSRAHYANPFNLTALASGAGGSTLVGDGRPQAPYGVNPNPAPYFDDGMTFGQPIAGASTAFAANTAALAGGTSAADNAGTAPGFIGTAAGGAGGDGVNNTAATYPGTGTGVSGVGLVPASSSVAAEGAGTEVVVTASVPNPSPAGQLVTVSCLGNFTGVANSPNSTHASSLSPATNPTLTSVSAGGASGAGNATCTATGTGFTRQSVMNVNGINYPTTFTSSTTISCSAPKKATAGSLPVVVITGGAVVTASQNWTFT